MAFESIPPVESAEDLLDIAFTQAQKSVKEARTKKMPSKAAKGKMLEITKVQNIGRLIARRLQMILQAFPSLDSVSEFYRHLIDALLDYDEIKQALGAVNWSLQQVRKTTSKYERMLKGSPVERINPLRREYTGRVASYVKQIDQKLGYLEQVRKRMRDWPSIKEAPTASLIGFPNVGKSTLLSQLTDANPKVANYAFTTLAINVGYTRMKYQKIQILDTPGTLHRFEKMNEVERIAHIAQRYASDMFVFVVDPAESYPLDEQKKLLDAVTRLRKPVVVYMSKTDVAPAEAQKEVREMFGECLTDVDAVRSAIQTNLL
ncbi:MAG: GTPase [Nanoarchaeota archaeon]